MAGFCIKLFVFCMFESNKVVVTVKGLGSVEGGILCVGVADVTINREKVTFSPHSFTAFTLKKIY